MSGEPLGSDGESDFELVDSQEARLPLEELNRIRKWLEPTDYTAESSEFQRHLRSRTPGTGTWICETERYKQWRNSPQHGCLWIKGVPGAGKSVLAASIVDQLQASNAPVLFFFFRHIILANRHPISLMRDWLAQLLPYSISVQGALHAMIDEPLKNVNENVLWDCILRGLEDAPKVFCVVDALDEMEKKGSEVFFQRLNRLAASSPSRLKLFMTSRPRQDLQSCLSAATILHISLEEDRVGKEIEVFIRHRLAQNKSVQDMDQEALAQKISTRSRGLFLYAKLLIDQILPHLESNAHIDMQALPVHLEDMYNEMLARQARKVGIDTKIQAALLGLITHAVRPMRLREVAGYLHKVHDLGSLEKCKNIARVACHPLLLILEDETVQVIHHSFTEFLLDTARTNPGEGRAVQFPILDTTLTHKDLAVSCLRVMNLASVFLRHEDEDPAITSPFLTYAYNYMTHVSYTKEIVAQDLFDEIAAICKTYQHQDDHGGFYWVRISSLCFAKSPLHFAAEAGLRELVRIELEKASSESGDQLLNAAGSEEIISAGSPFEIACRQNHIEIMEMIWSTKSCRPPDSTISASLMASILAKCHSQALEFLLRNGFQPDHSFSKKSLHETSPECLYLLTDYIPEAENSELICYYASCGYAKMLEIIILNKNPTVWRTKYGTALYQACAAEGKTPQHVDCVKLLLPTFHDINSRETIVKYGSSDEATPQPQKERTVLHALAANWHDGNHEISTQIFQLLIDAGADLETKDGMGDTPILCLFPQSFNKSVRKPLEFLLEAGAKVDVRDNEEAALIHRAVRNHIDVKLMEILLDHGADVNALWVQHKHLAPMPPLALFWDDTDWSNLMDWETRKGHERIEMNTRAELASYLIQKGARIDAGGDPTAVLVEALQCCDLETFKLMLQTCADSKLLEQAMFSLRHGISNSEGDQDEDKPKRDPVFFIQALISVGVSIEAKREDGATPLMASVEDVAVFDAFIKAGADLHATNNLGRGALFQLIDRRRPSRFFPATVERLRELVNLGLDPLKTDNSGMNLMHLAITLVGSSMGRSHEFGMLEQLLAYGLSPRSQSNDGLTPLHLYFHPEYYPWYGRAESGEHLLSLLEFLGKTKEGFDINAPDNEGLTPLHMAAMLCNKESITYVHVLLESGAAVRSLAQGNRNVLHLAARARNSAVVGYLISRNADLVHERDSNGRTPLFDACISGIADSVTSMLRAGADITARDDQGLTPLHACAEFIDEQRQWTKNEEAINSDQEICFDRYRPYILQSSPKQPKKFTPYLSLRFSRAANYVGAYLLENAELSILSVTECLLSAGADPVAKGTLDMITPMERASKLGCKGMLMALQRHLDASTFGVNPDNSALATADELDKKKILSEPWDFVSTLSIDDIAWLKLHQANFFMTLHKAEHEDSSFKRPFHRRFSFIEGVALAGLTEIMIQLGALARRDEDPDAAPIDKWTLNMISDNVTTSIPFEESGSWGKDTFWKPESIHTVGDYFRPTLWKVEPLLLTACRRECPNMEMLRVLIEICGVDVNCPSVIYDVGKEAQQSLFSHDLLPTLAFSQRFWHLDAIRYLVGKGANINQQDRKGMTALHHACASDKTFSVRFVELLLELGADFNIKDNKDRSSVDLAENPLVLQVLGRYGANISDHMTKFLWLGIGKLNIDLVQMALDNGADVNRKESCPIYTHEQLDWSIHSTPIHAREPAVPLAGALLYHDYTQPHVEKTGKDLRADIIKLLLDRGADPFGPMVLLRFSEDDEGVEQTIEEEVPLLHHIFDNSLCERRYLDLLVDYGLDFNKTGLKGETVFLAACNSAIIWTESYYYLTDDDEKEDKDNLMWDPSGLFLNMLDHGAEISAVNADGDNALHILLSNPSIQERHILEFLRKPEARPLTLVKDSKGFTPVQLGLKVLRPRVVEMLLSLGAPLCEPLFDPDGFTALHRIAAQCLTLRINSWRPRVRRLLRQPPDFRESCKRLWTRCLDAGLDIDMGDETPQHNPPLLHYLAHHPQSVSTMGQFAFSSKSKGIETCHVDHFDDFFATADLKVKNGLGNGALHIVAANDRSLDGEEIDDFPKRPDGHDAEVMRFLVGEKGLDPLLEDAKGRSSLDLAAALGRGAILDVFKPQN